KPAGLEAADDTARADEAWQSVLWQRIHASLTLAPTHPAVPFLQRVTGMGEAELATLGLPRTVHVFALPALPPLYLDILREL
ncbi:exodeoxyribonuclease V subunit gamma, partial [Escherichia coli]|uniref:exodeoxyribonuclease V subunit gamma n=1 Tax=Escherichia coli TaxID=562 RepID=UPI0028E0569A